MKFTIIKTMIICGVFGVVSASAQTKDAKKKAEKSNPVAVQNTNDKSLETSKVKIEDDKFSGTRAVSLLHQPLLPNLTVTLVATVEFRATKNKSPEGFAGTRNRAERENAKSQQDAEITFTATSIKTGERQYEGVTEFNFIIDGKRVDGGRIRARRNSLLPDDFKQTGVETIKSRIYLDTLAEIVRSNNAEMKLGSTTVVFDSAMKNTIKEFLAALR